MTDIYNVHAKIFLSYYYKIININTNYIFEKGQNIKNNKIRIL